MSDLKEMIGHGTTAKAAEKFANAIKMAKSTPAVDTILANYMLKGDGMGSGIGYNESTAVPVQSFKQFLSEARKADKFDAEKSASREVITQDQINEAIEVAKANGYKVITQEMIEEAKKVVESKGFKVMNENDEPHEPKKDVLFIRLYDYDPDEVADLINAALEDKSVPTYLRNIFKNGAKVRKDYVCIDLGTYEESNKEETIENLTKLVDAYAENAVGLEAEYDEELLDNYPFLFKNAFISF
jgi:hypothetical protein